MESRRAALSDNASLTGTFSNLKIDAILLFLAVGEPQQRKQRTYQMHGLWIPVLFVVSGSQESLTS